jgi:hypothetical protein
MFVKKFKRKCDVRGCKNTADVFLISKRREMGNTIAICTDCLKEAQSSINGYVEEKKAVVKENRPLFPHPELDVTLSSVADELPNSTEVIDAVAEETHISVAEDTVTIPKEEKPVTNTPNPKTTTNAKKKTNKKK